MSNKLDKRQTPFAFPLSSRSSYGSRTSYVSMVYFHYKKQNFGIPTNTNTGKFSDSEIMGVKQGVIEEEISSLRISKSLETTSSFSVSLLPSQNWKQILSPGDWVILYIQDDYQDKTRYSLDKNNKNMMLLGNIDRISRSLQKNEDDDKVELRYVISGRGFQKVFEETDVWYDPYTVQKDTLSRVVLANAGFELVGSPDQMIDSLIDIFLGAGANLKTGRTNDLNNWRIPSALANVFDAGKDKSKFHDILKREIHQNLPGYKVRQMVNPGSNGSLLDMMKRSSNELINELYFEETRSNDGKVYPTVFLKPRPLNTPFLISHVGDDPVLSKLKKLLENDFITSSDDKDSNLNAVFIELSRSMKTMQELANESFLEIHPSEIIYEDMGKDDHSRFNLFWLKPINSVEHVVSYSANNNTTKGFSNPTFLAPSIERHGLKRFDQILEFCHVRGAGTEQTSGTTSPEIALWKGFMLQLYDQNYANHLYESGTIECTGVLEAELGKALVILPTSDQAKKKIYFIEGYEHEWNFPNKWTTKFTLSHGQFKDQQNIFIDVLHNGDFGQEDVDIDLNYLAKTESQR